ncbi:enolase C-terminal domain-like protein [Nocardioides convexus]|uniref:enolase C-terminal domain-like protein n=1 Tax=Nocardioides convexus TaxID=2712224 RepID=UPI002418B34A|nr:enolase C-terminal domain-like protein [Nocardioides convexus]
MPFIADESATTPAEVTREVLGGSATALSIKTARTGFTGSQRVLHLAEGLGLEVVMGNQIDGQARLDLLRRLRCRAPAHQPARGRGSPTSST